MAVTQEPKQIHAGDDVNTSFDFPFYAATASNLTVTHTDTDGVETTLVNDVDYTVTGLAEEEAGVVTFPKAGSAYGVLATGEKLTNTLNEDFTQVRQFNNKTKYFPVEHGKAFDKVTRMVTQLKEAVDRAVKTDISSSADPDGIIDTIIQAEIDTSAASLSATASAAAALVSEGLAEDYKDEAQAASGGVRVSANDTTPSNLEAKLVAGAGLNMTTENEGANEVRTISINQDAWDAYDQSNDVAWTSLYDTSSITNLSSKIQAVKLTDTLGVIIHYDTTNGELWGTAVSRSGETLSFGAPTLCLEMTASFAMQDGGINVTKVRDDAFVVAATDSTGQDPIDMAVCSVSGTTITAGTRQTLSDSGSQKIFNFGMEYVSDDLFVMGRMTYTGSAYELVAQTISVSGTVMTFNSETQIYSGGALNGTGFVQLKMASATSGVIFFMNNTTRVHFAGIAISGTSVIAEVDDTAIINADTGLSDDPAISFVDEQSGIVTGLCSLGGSSGIISPLAAVVPVVYSGRTAYMAGEISAFGTFSARNLNPMMAKLGSKYCVKVFQHWWDGTDGVSLLRYGIFEVLDGGGLRLFKTFTVDTGDILQTTVSHSVFTLNMGDNHCLVGMVNTTNDEAYGTLLYNGE